MKVKQIRNYLDELESKHGDIDDVFVYYRHDYDSDLMELKFLEEDLFEEDNKTLYSVTLLTDNEYPVPYPNSRQVRRGVGGKEETDEEKYWERL